jgi:excisionase family DNA binding protein
MKATTVPQPPAKEVLLVEDGFATVPEGAQLLRLSRAKLYQMMDAGELAYAKFGRSRRIPRRVLLDYAARCMVGHQG